MARLQHTGGRALLVATCVAVLLTLSGCARWYSGSGRYFVYPPGKDAMGRDWQYRAFVSYLVPYGTNDYAYARKGARVVIIDSKWNRLVDETYEFGPRAGIEASATWSQPGTITVELRETDSRGYAGRNRPDDAYNAELVKAEGRTLKVVTFHLDPPGRRFVPVK